MLLVFIHLIIFSLCLLMKIFNIDGEIIGVFFMVTSLISVAYFVMSLRGMDKWMKTVILVGFLLRVVLVFIDVFIARLPDAGWDDDGFYSASLDIFNSNYSIISQNVYGGVFPKVLSIIYYFIGASRISIQYFNVLFFLLSALLFWKSLNNFAVSKRVQKIIMLFFCFIPNSILYNSILRREAIIESCVCLSLFYLSKWYKKSRLSYALMTIVFILLASIFHTAFILIAPIFVGYFALYDKKKKALSFSVTKIGKMAVLLVCALFIGVGFLSLWNNKFTSVGDMDDIYFAANRAGGGSVYLKEYEVHNLNELVLFTPLKLFYFLFSPVPWMFRNIVDLATFMFDALVYAFLLFRIIRNHKDTISKLSLTVFVFLSIVFALGTFNSGTAVRHRFSLSPYLLLSYAIVEDKRRKEADSSIIKGKRIGVENE